MNHIFKTVFNAALGTWQAVSELAKGRHKGQGATRRQAQRLRGSIIILLCIGLPGLPGTLWAATLPQNGQVIAGNASITLPNGHTLNVEQLSDKAIIDWQSFNIGKGNTVNFEQNNASSVALNRVTGNDPTAIYGNLNANGKVFLVNQNGVLFAEGANVNVGGLVASTLDIDNQDFLDGNYRFQGNGNQAVINRGNIHADGGAVALLGGHVSNEGIIHANLGSVAMAAGEKITLDFAGDGLINLTIDQGQLNALVENHGAIQADGGSVYLTTHAADQVLDSVVNNTGQIRAHTVEQREGKIILLADMQSGTANISGTLDASAPESASPNGGNGGFIETSGATVNIADDVHITTRADNGDTGTWLIDPNDFTIADSGGDITGATLSSQLANNNVEIESVNGATAGNGDIFVNDTVTWEQNTLTLSAERDIHINEALHAGGTAGLALEYGQGSANGEIGGRDATYHINAPVNLASTGSFSTQLGSVGEVMNYGIITDLNALQDINGDLGGHYVMGSDIDASATAGWNSGAGWNPIGNYSNRFTGTFDGLGHVISDLFIDRETTNYVGLFGLTNATLRNVGLAGGSITGRSYVGGLVGYQDSGTISQSYATGEVSGLSDVGGLVGYQRGGISQSYATGAVTGAYYVGGLVGAQGSGSISQSYATGAVSGTTGVGGLVGSVGGGSIMGSFYATTDSDGTARTGYTNTGGEGKTWTELMNRDTFADWDNAVWGFADYGADYAGYAMGGLPYLRGVTREEDIVLGGTLFAGGWGTDLDPYTITNWQQLQNINYNSDVLSGDYFFNLLNNLSSGTAGYDNYASTTANSGQGWNPIGNYSNRFTGTFDGLGHVISDLFIDRGTTDNVGLFGYNSNATLRHVGLENIDITGQIGVGGLVGVQLISSISESYATGVVSGYGYYVGGLVGWQMRGSISQSYATSAVNGNDMVGGLVGRQNSGSTIRESYATGEVNGTDYVGGLVGGLEFGTINQSYATGAVTGTSNVGGLVGSLNGSISESYAAGAVTGTDHIGGLVGSVGGGSIMGSFYATTDSDGTARTGYPNSISVGKTWAELMNRDTFAGWDIDAEGGTGSVWRIYEGHTSPLLRHFLTALTVTVDDDSVTYDGSTQTGNWKASAPGYDSNLVLGSIGGGRNAGTYALSGDGLYSGQQGYDLIIDEGTGTLTITVKVIDLINAVAQNREYNGTPDADVTADLDGVITGDDLQLAVNGAFDNKNAGIGKTVTVNGALSGADAGNYSLSGPATATADITAKVIDLINAVALNRTYDGTTGADVTAELDGVISGDDLAVALSGLFDNKNAGTGKTVTVTGALSGADAGNYTLSGPATTTADITAKVIDLINAIAQNRIYDGTTDADVTAELDGVVSGDDLDVALNGLFDDKNAGSDKTVTVSGTLSGADADNYSLRGSTTATADIAAKVIDLIKVVAQNRDYDGTTGADVTAELDGLISGDDLTLALTGLFDNKNAGTNKDVTVTGSLTGADANNYTLNGSVTTTADITAKVIDLINAVAQNRTYDGAIDADVTAELDGVITGDDLDVALSGLFDNKNAGTNKNVTIEGTLSGADAGNYTLSGPVTTTANITAKVIDLINAIAHNKVYDGTTGADVAADLDGLITGDDLQLAVNGAFADKNAGTNKNVTVTGSLTGADADNYTLSGPVITTADIAAKVIDLINAVAQNREYNGTTDADVAADLNGVISGDDLAVALNGLFDDKNAGTGKTVTVTGALSGADAGNYTLGGSATTTADITAKVIDLINAAAQNRAYDGTTSADVTAKLDGVISGDDLDVALVGLFDNKNAGTGKDVTVTGSLTGADANNYTLNGPVTTTADINAKVIDLINTVAQNREFNGTNDADVAANLDGVIAGDDLNVALNGQFDNRNAGTGKTVTVNGTLSGADAGNYTLRGPATANANITAKVIDLINAVAQNRVYDGTTDADVAADLGGVIAGDDLDVALNGLLDNKNAGSNKTVTVTGTLSGADAGNYTLSGPATATADITAKVIDLINTVAQNRVYDGTRNADVAADLDGVISGDDLVVALVGLFDDKNASTGRTVTVNGALSGADAGNYTLSGPTTTTADISAKVIDLINAIAHSKVYDGTTDADVVAGLDGVISGDDLDVALTGLFEDAKVGDNKTVTVSGELSGGDSGNYQLRGPVQTVASITDPALPVGYYAAIRAPQGMPIDMPGAALLPLTIEGEGLNLQGLAGEVVLMTTGALGNRAADQQ